MSKEKIIIALASLLACSAVVMAAMVFRESQKKDSLIKSLQGKEQEAQSALTKAQELQSDQEKTISEFKVDLEKMTAEKIEAEEKIKSFALQVATCDSLRSAAKKH